MIPKAADVKYGTQFLGNDCLLFLNCIRMKPTMCSHWLQSAGLNNKRYVRSGGLNIVWDSETEGDTNVTRRR